MTENVSNVAFAVLADVDGPISNLDTKRIADDRIIASLATLLNAGIPVVLNTGQSASFVQRNIFESLRPFLSEGVNVLALCEKGAVVAEMNCAGYDVSTDDSYAVPGVLAEEITKLVDEQFSSSTFVDDTKLTMISTERRLGVDQQTYSFQQHHFVRACEKLIKENGFSVVHQSDKAVAAQLSRARKGSSESGVVLRVEPTRIATDIEHVDVGKHLGARRAVAILAERQIRSTRWYTLGDSPSDADMACALAEFGYQVTHFDVGQNVFRATKSHAPWPYELVQHENAVYDDAGSIHLRSLAESVALGL